MALQEKTSASHQRPSRRSRGLSSLITAHSHVVTRAKPERESLTALLIYGSAIRTPPNSPKFNNMQFYDRRQSRGPKIQPGAVRMTAVGLRALLGAEGLDYVDAGCARGGQDRRNHRGGEQHERRDEHRQDAGHAQVAEIAGGNTSHDEAERGSGEHTRRGHDGAFAHDGTQKIFRLRAEGEPDAKLARARANGKGQHTGDSDDGDRERHNRKYSKDERVQAVGRENFR